MLKIELKNIKHAQFASEETHCYNATLYVAGETWGEVSNEGRGGPDHFHGVAGKSWDDIKALNERIAAEYPKIDCTDIGAPGDFLDQNLETVCGELVNEFLVAKDLQRALKKAVLFYKAKPEAKGAPLYEIKLKGKAWDARMEGLMQKNHPGAIILNALPIAEALPLYRMAG